MEEHHHEEHKEKKKPRKRLKKYRIWQIVSLVLGLIIIVLFFKVRNCGVTGNVLAADAAGEKVINYINNNLGVTASLVGVEEEGDLYNVGISVNGQNFNSYVTKDGKFLFPQAIDMDVQQRQTATNQEAATEVPKSDKPNVELFVMSHCPYGTQAEKGILPVVDLLGDKIDFNVRFVYYAMHGQTEIDEETRQYCIQKEQQDKFTDYLACFLKGGDSETCLTESGVDISKLNLCMAQTDRQFGISEKVADRSTWLSGRYPLFDVDKELNERYGVGGSPTLIINGETVSSGRDPAAYLSVVCSAFNEEPEECSEELSSESLSPGFGYESGSGSSGGSCS